MMSILHWYLEQAQDSQTITIRGYQVHLEASNPTSGTDMNVTDTKVLANKFITKV